MNTVNCDLSVNQKKIFKRFLVFRIEQNLLSSITAKCLDAVASLRMTKMRIWPEKALSAFESAQIDDQSYVIQEDDDVSCHNRLNLRLNQYSESVAICYLSNPLNDMGFWNDE